jgi:hypothetical protein
MDRVPIKRGRLALAIVAVMLVAGFAVPGVAFAKSATRIVVSKSSVIADWSTGTVSPSKSVTAKLQKKSGSKWVSLKGTIKVSFHDSTTESYSSLLSRTGSSVSIPLSTRGAYKLYYAGSSTTKPATSHTKRMDSIGTTISDVTATFSTIDSTWTGVTISYDVGWNTGAYWFSSDYPLLLNYLGDLENSSYTLYSGYVSHSLEIWEPGTFEFSYRVKTADIPSGATLVSGGWITSEDAYIYIPDTVYADNSTTY